MAIALGVLVPAPPALAALPENQASPARTTAESSARPTIDLERGAGNTVTITMSNGIGHSVRLVGAINGKDVVLWTAPSKVNTAQYKVRATYSIKQTGLMFLRAEAMKNGSAVAQSLKYTVWLQPSVPPAITPAITIYPLSKNADPVKRFSFSGKGFTGAKISLQRLDAGTWKTAKTTGILKADEPTLSATLGAEGTAVFRGILTKDGKTIATSSTLKVTYARQATSVYANVRFGDEDKHVRAGAQRSVTFGLNGPLGERRGTFQVYRNGAWATLQTVRFTAANGWSAAVKTPLVSATVKQSYRLVIEATPQEKAWTSSTTVIEHLSTRDYDTYFKKTASNYMKAYCPNQAIRLIDGPISYADYPAYVISMGRGVQVGLPLQFVALHECAHILSYRLYSKDVTKLYSRMNAIYGNRPDGMEQLADCMAYAMGGTKGFGYYTGNCSGARGDAARKVLAGRKP